MNDGAMLRGFRGFLLVWLGQLVSLTGTAMTRFALTIWAYTETESATVLALMGFFSFAPIVIFSPLAGALTDRWSRKTVMMLSDLMAGLSTVALFVLFSSGNLEIWHLYAAGAFAGVFEAFQFPAFSAAITLMIKKRDFARASAMLGMAQTGSTIAAPVLAGTLLALGGLQIILVLDIVTFVFAVSTIMLVFIPQPKDSTEGKAARGNLWQESIFGFGYIWKRHSLFGMQMIFFFTNLFMGVALILIAPLVLSQTNNNETALALVQSAAGAGGLIGGIIMSVWGGPKRRVHGVLLATMGTGLFGAVLLGAGNSIFIWILASFFMVFFIPIIDASNQAIWQSKVPPDLQGRVFAARRLIAQITVPVAMLIAGPLVDVVFEPAMMENGTLAAIFGGFIGTGAGAGTSLLFILMGVLTIINGFAGYLIPVIRNIESILPDYIPDSSESIIAEEKSDAKPSTDNFIDAPAPAGD